MTIEGATQKEDGKVYCNKCNNDLTEPGSIKFVAHADGPKVYQQIYNCTICGNVIKEIHERRKPWI